MPTYEYICDACGSAFEKFQSMTAKPIKDCPSCGKKKVRRLISAGAGLIFKGSGFYITDYRSKGYTDAAKADSSGGVTKTETKTEGKSETKTETKAESTAPATKTEAKPATTATASKKK